MSLIQCSCDCLYQNNGYCNLDNAAEITNISSSDGCLHFVPSKSVDTKKSQNSVIKKKVYSKHINNYGNDFTSINKNNGV